MPGFRHEAVVEILRNEPLLVPLLLTHAGVRIRFPRGAVPLIADSNLSDREPRRLKVFLADNVFVFEGNDRKIAVVAEVQASRPSKSRSLAWPAYIANARARHGCDTLLMVFATDPEAARGSARTVRTGHPGYDLTPLLTGIGKMPQPGGPRFAAELLLLNVITGDLALDTHEAQMLAVTTIRFALPERLERYTRYILELVSPSVQEPLESLMKTVLKNAFVDGLLDQGRTEGRAEMLLQLLGRRFEVPHGIRSRVAACSDPTQISTWFDRAITATSLDEVFAELALPETQGLRQRHRHTRPAPHGCLPPGWPGGPTSFHTLCRSFHTNRKAKWGKTAPGMGVTYEK